MESIGKGVPQGIAQGLMAFNVHINDLAYIVKDKS